MELEQSLGNQDSKRVRYTKAILRESLLSLMQDVPFCKISVSTLCARADVNRSTYYMYYKDPYDLLCSIQDELYREISQSLTNFTKDILTIDTFKAVFEIIYKNRDLCRVILGPNADFEFILKLYTIKREETIALWKLTYPAESESKLRMLHAFLASGIAGIIQKWVKNDFSESPQELANLVKDITTGQIPILSPHSDN